MTTGINISMIAEAFIVRWSNIAIICSGSISKPHRCDKFSCVDFCNIQRIFSCDKNYDPTLIDENHPLFIICERRNEALMICGLKITSLHLQYNIDKESVQYVMSDILFDTVVYFTRLNSCSKLMSSHEVIEHIVCYMSDGNSKSNLLRREIIDHMIVLANEKDNHELLKKCIAHIISLESNLPELEGEENNG